MPLNSCRAVFTFLAAAVIVGQTFAMTPDYSKAKVAAQRILYILKSVPSIDNQSEEGIKPVSRKLLGKTSNILDFLLNLVRQCQLFLFCFFGSLCFGFHFNVCLLLLVIYVQLIGQLGTILSSPFLCDSNLKNQGLVVQKVISLTQD